MQAEALAGPIHVWFGCFHAGRSFSSQAGTRLTLSGPPGDPSDRLKVGFNGF